MSELILQPRRVRVRRDWWRHPRPQVQATDDAADQPGRSLAFDALVGFTFILLIAPQEHFTFLSPLHLAVLTSVTAAGAMIRDRSRAKQKILPRAKPVTFALLLAAWALSTMPFSLWPGGSWGLFSGIYFKAITIFLLLGAIIDTGPKLRNMAWAISLCSLPLGYTAISNYLHHNVVAGPQAVARIVGYQSGLSLNPNDLALILNLILPVSAALFFTEKGALRKTIFGFATLLTAGAVVATFSRAGFLTLAAIFVGLAWKLRKRPERVWIWGAGAMALFAVFLFLPAGYLSHLGTITNIQKDATGSAQERTRDMALALNEIAKRPLLGAGLGQNVLALNTERGPGSDWRMVHNVYLQYAADLGIPGLLLFLAVFKTAASGLSRAVKKLREVPSMRAPAMIAEGLQLSLLGFALAGFFHPAGYNFPFFFFAGLAVAAHGIAFRSQS